VKEQLAHFNGLLMHFRDKLNPARNKRIAHTDLHSQVNRLEAMGCFDKGEDVEFYGMARPPPGEVFSSGH
jgi:hypothetical protein